MMINLNQFTEAELIARQSRIRNLVESGNATLELANELLEIQAALKVFQRAKYPWTPLRITRF